MPGAIVALFVSGALLFIFLVPVSWFIFRNAKLHRLKLRYLFSISVVPLLVFFMSQNYFLVDYYFPKLIELQRHVPDYGDSMARTIVGVAVTCALSFFGCYVWFQLVSFMDRLPHRGDHSGTAAMVADSSGGDHAPFHARWLCLFIGTLLVNLLVVLPLLNLLEKNGWQTPEMGLAVILSALPISVVILYLRKRKQIRTPGKAYGIRQMVIR